MGKYLFYAIYNYLNFKTEIKSLMKNTDMKYFQKC